MQTNKPESYEFQEFRRIAEYAFTDAAMSYIADDMPLLDGGRDEELQRRVAKLAPQFLDLSGVPEAEWGSRDAAVSRGLYEALVNPDLGVVVQGLCDELLRPDLEEVEEALRRAGLTPDRMTELAAESADPVRLAADPDTSPDLLESLAGHKSEEVRSAVAENPATPPETLFRLAGDEDEGVRWGVERNPNVTEEAQIRLAEAWANDTRSSPPDHRNPPDLRGDSYDPPF